MNDPVNHPSHYTSGKAVCKLCDEPIECIDITQHMGFCLGNAVKYNRPGGVINVALTRRGNIAEIRVGNTGAGLGENDRQRLFERCYSSIWQTT